MLNMLDFYEARFKRAHIVTSREQFDVCFVLGSDKNGIYVAYSNTLWEDHGRRFKVHWLNPRGKRCLIGWMT